MPNLSSIRAASSGPFPFPARPRPHFPLSLGLLLILIFILRLSVRAQSPGPCPSVEAAGPEGPSSWTVQLQHLRTLRSDSALFLGYPTHIAAGGEYVYVSDAADLTIKVFTAAGRYLQTVGGRGRGPGRYKDLSALWTDADGHLWAADDRTGTIDRYGAGGTLTYETAIRLQGMAWPRAFHPLPGRGGGYLVVYQPAFSSEELFHRWDPAFTPGGGSFGLPPGLIRGDPLRQAALADHPGTTALQPGTGRLLYAPYFYGGRIYSRRPHPAAGGADAWQMHPGHPVAGPAYTLLPPGRRHTPDGRPAYDGHLTAPEGDFAYRHHHQSRALLFTRRGYLLHFTETRPRIDSAAAAAPRSPGRQRGIEIYDRKLRCRGYVAAPPVAGQPRALHRPSNRLYTIAYEPEPVIHIYRLAVVKR